MTKGVLESWKLLFSYINENKNKNFSSFRPIFDFELKRKRSRAELSWKSFSSSSGSSQLGSNSSLVSTVYPMFGCNWGDAIVHLRRLQTRELGQFPLLHFPVSKPVLSSQTTQANCNYLIKSWICGWFTPFRWLKVWLPSNMVQITNPRLKADLNLTCKRDALETGPFSMEGFICTFSLLISLSIICKLVSSGISWRSVQNNLIWCVT